MFLLNSEIKLNCQKFFSSIYLPLSSLHSINFGSCVIGSFWTVTLYCLYTEPLKKSLKIETQSWREMLCRYLKDEFGKKMTDTSVKNEDHLQQLSIPVANLEDVRRAMAILSKFRDTEIDTDMTLISIEVWRPQKQDCMSYII